MAITTEQVMIPTKIKLPWLFWIVYAFLTYLSYGLLLLALPFVYPVAQGLVIKQKGAQRKKDALDAMEKFMGERPQYIDTAHSCRQSDKTVCGTGIAYANQNVYIMDHGLCAKLELEDIRSWKWSIEGVSGGSVFVGGNPIETTINNSVSNIQHGMNKFAAWVQSGFFITVADINKPIWQFMTVDKNVLDKWMEIFDQWQEGKI